MKDDVLKEIKQVLSYLSRWLFLWVAMQETVFCLAVLAKIQ